MLHKMLTSHNIQDLLGVLERSIGFNQHEGKTVGVKNGYDEVNVQISVKISRQRTRIQIGHGQAQVWPSDHAQAKLGRYVATKYVHGLVAM
ncbi:hypothetical protein F2Q70_00035477 [Brassica cretica]|uniref:Uncharacterized protein n=1 Tax=Brassica cretica TaxID=69181 RepID=A0A8S9JUN7_BRACR|nr:hypothetical protein F2Q70_00035477 [Brassica cretica]